MNEFIKLLDDGFEISLHKEKTTGCYVFVFKKGKKKLRLKMPDSINTIREDLILDKLAENARDNI